MRTLAISLAMLLSGSAGMADAETTPPARFSMEAELRARALSTCGRYAIDAMARYAPAAMSTDGRYTLRAINLPAGGCDPFPDELFADGFEGP
jgi:hypothetical protein